MTKKTKKCIVNGLTIARIIGTFLIPTMFNLLSPFVFVILISSLFFTDFLDGKLARHWGVSTIAGSILDMGADKLFGFAVLIALSSIYPIMLIPALLEGVVVATNLLNVNNGGLGKSSQIGRIKTLIMWGSISVLLLTGLSNEIIESLNNTSINNVFQPIINTIKYFMNKINSNKENIETIFKTAAITSESMTTLDYLSEAVDIKNNKDNMNNEKLINILKDKEKLKYIKSILLDEKYYLITKNMNLINKLNPTEKDKENIKKLILKSNNESIEK